jgi:two-component system sensor histidine kinase PhoQ
MVMAGSSSVTRQLLWSVGLPLVLFFSLTGVGLDYLFRNLVERSLSDLLDQRLVALVSAAESTADGGISMRIADPDSRLVVPDSGRYAQIIDAGGAVVWSSPSILTSGLTLGASLPVGKRAEAGLRTASGQTVRALWRGLRWDLASGRSRDLVFVVAESTAVYDAQLRRFRQVTGGWFVLLTVVMVAALAALLQRALRPLLRLEGEIREVEAGWREQLSEGYPRELSGTATNLNQLLVSEKRRMTRYRDTLGNLAHELKTPLAVMRQALRSESAPQASIDREIGRMSTIIDRQLTRGATSGAVTVGQSAVAVGPLAADLRASLLRVHASKDLVIELHVTAEAGFLGEAGDLTEMLGNLLDNACKWCRQRVRLRAYCMWPAPGRAKELHIVVEDDGPGIAPQDRERVLTRGARADELVQGHGLGLAIVRDSVATYNGRLSIGVSEELGGASLHLVLPGRAVLPA